MPLWWSNETGDSPSSSAAGSRSGSSSPKLLPNMSISPQLQAESRSMKVVKCPTDELSYSNRVGINPQDKDQFLRGSEHVKVSTGGRCFLFSIAKHNSLTPGSIAFNNLQRKWAMVTLGQEVQVESYIMDAKKDVITSLTCDIDFINKKSTTLDPINSDELAIVLRQQFVRMAVTCGQSIVFQVEGLKVLLLTIRDIEVLNVASGECRPAEFGEIRGNTIVTFEKGEGSPINLTGKSKGKQSTTSIINPDWDFNKMGIGGLDKEFSAIFRRAFASRVFPPEVITQLGMKHCRGILLFGPPGTGKTLMARQIGNMLNAREPKIVNGPQVLDKYVGESEAKIRELFKDAEEEEKRMGPNSGLHIIIFDEIDAICKARGSVAGSSAVHDTVVNQLLSKIDGVDQLNNILVIGMTNRKDMIDEALLRPGRLEVQMEIGLPDEFGRTQILKIHTEKMRDNDKLQEDVDINEFAGKTKNFSGAELEGLVRAATSTAMNRLIKASSKVEVDPDAFEKLKVTRSDFLHALEHDVKPAFGVSQEELLKYVDNGIIDWGEPVQRVLEKGDLLVNKTKTSKLTPLVTLLLSGPPNSGKTALAAQIATTSQFPFLKICSPENMLGYHEAAKCSAIKKMFDDAYKSPLSCIILDDIERLMDFSPIGPRFSNLVLQTLLVLLRKKPPGGKKIMIIGTTSRKTTLEELEMVTAFSSVEHVSNLSTAEHLISALNALNSFPVADIQKISSKVQGRKMWIGIKKLLHLVETAKQGPRDSWVTTFLYLLEDEASLEM